MTPDITATPSDDARERTATARDPGGEAVAGRRRLVAASNRLPVALERDGGEWIVEPGSGGLVTALEPVLQDHGGRWVGWTGAVDTDGDGLREPLSRVSEKSGFGLVPVELTTAQRDQYYYGFSNEVLWPLLHELPTRYSFDPAYWDAYREVNEKFADVLAEQADDDDLVWVHDYHLMGVGKGLRKRGREGPIAYFLHTPFPTRDLFLKLPWRAQVLDGLLSYDLLGFQTVLDRDNFLAAVDALFPECRIEGEGAMMCCVADGRPVRAGAFPISIDVGEFERVAASAEVEGKLAELRSRFEGRPVVLGVDRLDYTKGIPHRLEAFRTLLEEHPDLRGRVSLVQIVVPSREGIPEYDDLKTEIERMVGEINGQFSRDGWVPVHFFYRSLDRPELVAYYRRADVALVTPLKDGMNLVAKEYCAAQVDEAGVLVLSEFAGAAAQLQDDALLVNPHDVGGTARAVRRALAMGPDERRQRMRRLRQLVHRHDIYWWVDAFLEALDGAGNEDLGELRRYIPGAPRHVANGRTDRESSGPVAAASEPRITG